MWYSELISLSYISRHWFRESFDAVAIGPHWIFPDNKVHGANMGPTWVLSAPDGPHVGPMNLAIRVNMQLNVHCVCLHYAPWNMDTVMFYFVLLWDILYYEFLYDLCDIVSHILQGCFTGVGAIVRLANASEIPLRYMDKIILHTTTIRYNKSCNVCTIPIKS